MTLDDILKCVRPLLFETESGEYKYCCKGTCFIVAYKEEHFVVTAKHCLTNQGFPPETVRVLTYPDDREFLPIAEYSAFRSLPGQEKAPETDIAAFQIAHEYIQRCNLDKLRAYTLRPLDICPIIGSTKLVCRGYPSELGAVDYDELTITNKAFVVEAEQTQNGSLPECEEMRFVNRNSIDSPDGMWLSRF